jgi:type IV pilus assembly protein PilB
VTRTTHRIGELLKAAGLITEQQLQTALEQQAQSGTRLGRLLVAVGAVSELQLTQVLSNQLSVAWVSLPHVDMTEELLLLVPRTIALKWELVPVHFRIGEERQKILYVAISDPTNVEAMQDVARLTGMNVRPLIAPPSEILRTIEVVYKVRA